VAILPNRSNGRIVIIIIFRVEREVWSFGRHSETDRGARENLWARRHFVILCAKFIEINKTISSEAGDDCA
jgi:hypothetical protein